MDGRTIALSIATGVFAIATVWLGISNSGLQGELDALQSDLSTTQADLAKAQAKLALAEEQAPNDPARVRPRRLMRGGEGAGAGPMRPMRPRGPGAGAEGPARERLEEMRDRVREKALERLTELVRTTGEERGWDPSVVDEATVILQTSWEDTNEVRERMRNRELEPTAARTALVAIREAANEDLTQVLGEEEHAILREAMQSNAPR